MGLGKRRKAEAAPYKRKLYETPEWDWVTAQFWMDNIVAITGQKPGKNNGKIQPRLCTACNHWGHTREHCDVWKQAYIEEYGEPPAKQKDIPSYVPLTKEEIIERFGEEHWMWVVEFKRLKERFNAAWDAECATEPKWSEFCEQWDTAHPPFPEGRPYNAMPGWKSPYSNITVVKAVCNKEGTKCV